MTAAEFEKEVTRKICNIFRCGNKDQFDLSIGFDGLFGNHSLRSKFEHYMDLEYRHRVRISVQVWSNNGDPDTGRYYAIMDHQQIDIDRLCMIIDSYNLGNTFLYELEKLELELV